MYTSRISTTVDLTNDTTRAAKKVAARAVAPKKTPLVEAAEGGGPWSAVGSEAGVDAPFGVGAGGEEIEGEGEEVVGEGDGEVVGDGVGTVEGAGDGVCDGVGEGVGVAAGGGEEVGGAEGEAAGGELGA
ncbi:hypothetical protein PVK06_043600 [Gossypium arboreum]|uniref:Uncharacterized protein n=1 Tax=Gossypium arboreum TaxID=29729 RepID=A0ABR0MPA7_GOSAR|nr:hypothetical protein PVK06_043600 [Gossypium arboreum]